jgi:hypothetical protein
MNIGDWILGTLKYSASVPSNIASDTSNLTLYYIIYNLPMTWILGVLGLAFLVPTEHNSVISGSDGFWLAKCCPPRVAGGLGCASMGDLVGKCNWME